MKRTLGLVALSLAALISAPAHAEGGGTAAAAVAALYAPYQQTSPDWDAIGALKSYSAETEALIQKWEAGLSQDEVEDLADFDWLCECQDWDSTAFKVTVEPQGEPVEGWIEVATRIDLGWGETREARFIMVQQEGLWKVEDLFSESFPQGLRFALAEALAERGR